MSTSKELFFNRCKEYFNDESERFISLLNEKPTSAFVLNNKKASSKDIFDIIDFKYKKSSINESSYLHFNDSIGKSKAYELGLIYPQDSESSLPATYIKNPSSIKTAIDLCAAPGGKTINVINRLNDDITFISNDVNSKRVRILQSNLERLGLDNVVVTSLDPNYFVDKFEGCFDLVILDAPCSGEGMIRKYPEILDTYNITNIEGLAKIQSNLLEVAYKLLKKDGQLLYSTCTYAFEEDENQIINFLNRHHDIELIKLDNIKGNHSKLEGTVKLSPLNGCEGQFISLLTKKDGSINEIRNKKEFNKNNNVVNSFIKDNLDINNYYLYCDRDNFYLSLYKLPDIEKGYLTQGVFLGTIIKDRFEPSHSLYRSNTLRNCFKYVYELNDNEYDMFVSGSELKVNLDNHYYLLTYKGYSIGFGKVSNNVLKNKYPKGLRRVI